MYYRLVTRDDLPQLAEVSAAAFINDILFDHLSPKRHQFPEDWVRSFLVRHKLRFVSPGKWCVLCVSDQSDVPGGIAPGRILGLAWWERETKAGTQQSAWTSNNSTMAHRLERVLLRLESLYDELLCRDRSVNSAAVAAFMAEVDETDPFAHIPDKWYLSHLAVHPDFQRMGIGSHLVQFGVDRSRQDNVPATLNASPIGRGVYSRIGFRIIDAQHIPGQNDGDPAMICDPTGLWVRAPHSNGVMRLGMPIEVFWTDWALEQMERDQLKRVPEDPDYDS